MQNKIDSAALLYGFSIFGKSKADLLTLVEKRLNNKNELLTIATPNPEQIVLAHHNEAFKGYLHQFELLLPDGQGLVWAARRFSADSTKPLLTERIAGREVVAFLIGHAVKHQLKVLVVGGRGYEGGIIPAAEVGGPTDSVIVPAASTYAETKPYPVYWTPAYQQVAQPTADEQRQLEQTLTDLKPDLVFVAFGAPYQEEWVINHARLLEESGVRLAMVVGGSFDYLLGKVPKTPAIMSSLGLEWLFRLVSQPWRWKRQLKLIEFIALTLSQKTR